VGASRRPPLGACLFLSLFAAPASQTLWQSKRVSHAAAGHARRLFGTSVFTAHVGAGNSASSRGTCIATRSHVDAPASQLTTSPSLSPSWPRPIRSKPEPSQTALYDVTYFRADVRGANLNDRPEAF